MSGHTVAPEVSLRALDPERDQFVGHQDQQQTEQKNPDQYDPLSEPAIEYPLAVCIDMLKDSINEVGIHGLPLGT
jgi:hypothetical protein